jgi:manganese-dependent inorganic pyrophosphatase
MLIIYSVPVGRLGDTSVPLVKLNDPIKSFWKNISKAPSRHLPVADEEGKVVGIIFEGDLAKEPNVEVIMVDHNEPSQAIEGIENYKILEIIDHHRLGNLSTSYPIMFINRVVGATCTIITNLYREQKIPLEKPIASILLCAILTDTLALKSATTTEVDIEAAEYLSTITGLDIQNLVTDLQAAANKVVAMPADELISLDAKKYTENSQAFCVSQIEIDDTAALMERKDEISAALENARVKGEYLFAALLVTDITTLDSLLFVAGSKTFTALITFPVAAKGIYELKGVVSRKKQLMPLLTELVSRYIA